MGSNYRHALTDTIDTLNYQYQHLSVFANDFHKLTNQRISQLMDTAISHKDFVGANYLLARIKTNDKSQVIEQRKKLFNAMKQNDTSNIFRPCLIDHNQYNLNNYLRIFHDLHKGINLDLECQERPVNLTPVEAIDFLNNIATHCKDLPPESLTIRETKDFSKNYDHLLNLVKLTDIANDESYQQLGQEVKDKVLNIMKFLLKIKFKAAFDYSAYATSPTDKMTLYGNTSRPTLSDFWESMLERLPTMGRKFRCRPLENVEDPIDISNIKSSSIEDNDFVHLYVRHNNNGNQKNLIGAVLLDSSYQKYMSNIDPTNRQESEVIHITYRMFKFLFDNNQIEYIK